MRKGLKLFAALSVAILNLALAAQVSAQTFSGRATGVKATVITGVAPGVTTAVTDTGPLPSAGGTITLASASANVANILTAGASTVTTSGSGNTSQSTASIETLDVSLTGYSNALRVRASALSSSTQCDCPARTCTGNSTVTNLRLGQAGGGTEITVTGEMNQTVVVVVGNVTLTLVINEHIVSPGSLTVNALHITLADSLTGTTTDVVVASSHSEITCIFAPPVDRYSGRATGVWLGVSTLLPPSQVATIISDSGFLPTSGGNIAVSTASANVTGVLTTGIVTSNTSGGIEGGSEDTSQSDSEVNNLSASLIGDVTINASLLQSNTMCQCSLTSATCTGGSVVTDLAVVAAGIPVSITITGAPNQIVTLPLGLGTIIINEQLSAGDGDITVNALHVLLSPAGLASTDLVIAHSHSDIQCALSPTAAGALVSGRVLDPSGDPIANARIQIMDAAGEVWQGTTSAFGEYGIDGIPAGGTYLVTVTHRRYTFGSRVITVKDNLAGVDFTAETVEPVVLPHRFLKMDTLLWQDQDEDEPKELKR